MHTKLIYLTCLVLVLGLALTSTASAEIVGWWKFDKGSGTIAQDSSRYNNDVFFNGDPQWVAGYFNGGLEFDGSGDYLDRGVYEPSLDIVGELTFTAWVKPGATLRDHEIGGNITTGPMGGGYMMGIYSNNYVELEVRNSEGTSAPPNRPGGGTALQTGTWYFLASTYSQTAEGGVITTYVNGEFDGELVTTIVMDPSPGTFKIGRDPSAPGSGQFIGIMDDVRLYNHVLTEDELWDVMLGKGPKSKIAFAPLPEDEQIDVPRDALLGWTPGIYAQKHDVYFGTVFEDVNNADRNNPLDVLVRRDQDVNMYDPGLLDFGQTYFWRIDEVNAPPDPTIFKGNVWSFTVGPFAYPTPSENITPTASSYVQGNEPNNTTNGSGVDIDDPDLHSIDTTTMWLSETGDPGSAWIQYDFDRLYKLHQMLVWNYNGPSILTGFALRDVTVEYSEDGETWTVLPDANEFAQAPGTNGYEYNTTVDFNSVVAKSVRITANSNWGGGPFFSQYGLSEVRFLYIPVNAREPNPDSGATDVNIDVTLGWRAGREAAEHNVYLSTDEQAVIDGTAPVATVTDAGYSPSESLILDSTYYWRVDEVNNAETPTTWQGDIWNFTTTDHLVVDDFEDYNDYPPDEIWSTWSDGYGDPLNGSNVGYPNPNWIAGEHYVETTVVHGGEQSAPFLYDNTIAGYSEVSVNPGDLAVGSDWTVGSPETLVLWFHGDSDNAATEQMYVKVNGVKVVYPGDAADITRPIWKQWNIDLAALGVDLSNVTQMSIGFERTGGVGGSGMVLIDDILLYRSAPPVPLEEIWIEAEAAGTITSPMKTYDDPLASGGKYIGTDDGIGDENSAPPPDGIATYNFTVKGGTYKIELCVLITGGSNSLWIRIPDATNYDPGTHSSGWIRFNDISDGAEWHWDEVHSSDHGDQVVKITLPAGVHTLEIARREDGALLDAIVISKVEPPAAPVAPSEQLMIEAEDANPIGTLIQVVDDPTASGGKYITVEAGNNSMDAPDLPNGAAAWTFTVAGGTYKIDALLTTLADDDNDDSCWFRIQGAEINRNIHSSGWIRHNDARPRGGPWGLDEIHSSEDGGQTVHFTLAPGTYTLEFAYREDGLWLDAIVISKID